ncbi:MAG: retention module-containing protein [Neptuniibacter sp.]
MNIVGTVSLLIGKVVAVKADGSERILALGDQVFADEMVRVSPDGAIEIAMDAGDPVRLEGGQSWLASSETHQTADDFDLSEAVADVDSIQAAILAGVDPTEVSEATAAGGDAGAGGDGNEGSSTVNVDRTAGEVDPTAGFDTIGFSDPLTQQEETLLDLDEPPVVSVTLELTVDDPEGPTDPTDPTDPSDPGTPTTGEPVMVSADTANVLEGTSDEGGREVTFYLRLDRVFDQDVEVTYQFNPQTADNPDDWFDGELINTVTIPAGTSLIPVTVTIVQDHLDEGDEIFTVQIIDAVNADINPAADSATVVIFDDDTTPVAQDDFNSVQEDTVLSTSGNVVGGEEASAGDNPDTDEDGDTLTILTVDGVEVSSGTEITGNYGTLTINADGSYTYVLDNDAEDVQALDTGDGLTDSFSYVVTDGYNEPQNATLTINLDGLDEPVPPPEEPVVEVRTERDVRVSEKTSTEEYPGQEVETGRETSEPVVEPIYDDAGNLIGETTSTATTIYYETPTDHVTTTTVTTETYERDITTTTYPDGTVNVATGDWVLIDTQTESSDSTATTYSYRQDEIPEESTDYFPIANDDTFLSVDGAPITSASVTGNDIESGDGDHTYELVGDPIDGLTFNSDGTFSYNPSEPFSEDVTFDYKIVDEDLDSNTATVTITGEISPPTISIDDVTVNEDAGTMTFTVSLSHEYTDDVTFDFASAEQDPVSATADTDYSSVSGSDSIEAGDLTTTIEVPITDDFYLEGDESFYINLTNVTNVADSGNDFQGEGTIQDVGSLIDDDENPETPDVPAETAGAEDTVTLKLFTILGSVGEGEGDLYASAEDAEEAGYTVDADGRVLADANTVSEGDAGDYVAYLTAPDGSIITAANGEIVGVTFGKESDSASGAESQSTPDGSEDFDNSGQTVTLGTPFETAVFDDYAADSGEEFTVEFVDASFSDADTYEEVEYGDAVTTTISDNTPEGEEWDPESEGNPEGPTGAEDTVFAVISVDESSVSEGETLTYTISLEDENGDAVSLEDGTSLTVDLVWSGVADDSDVEGTLPATVTLNATDAAGTGSNEFTFEVEASVDEIREGDEPLVATISNVSEDLAAEEEPQFEQVAPGTEVNGYGGEGSVVAESEITDAPHLENTMIANEASTTVTAGLGLGADTSADSYSITDVPTEEHDVNYVTGIAGNGDSTILTSGGTNLVYVDDGEGGLKAVLEDDQDGDAVFTISLNDDGTYTVNTLGEVDAYTVESEVVVEDEQDPVELSSTTQTITEPDTVVNGTVTFTKDMFSGGGNDGALVGTETVVTDNGDITLTVTITGDDGDNTDGLTNFTDDVNWSNQGIGVESGAKIGVDDTLRFDVEATLSAGAVIENVEVSTLDVSLDHLGTEEQADWTNGTDTDQFTPAAGTTNSGGTSSNDFLVEDISLSDDGRVEFSATDLTVDGNETQSSDAEYRIDGAGFDVNYSYTIEGESYEETVTNYSQTTETTTTTTVESYDITLVLTAEEEVEGEVVDSSDFTVTIDANEDGVIQSVDSDTVTSVTETTVDVETAVNTYTVTEHDNVVVDTTDTGTTTTDTQTVTETTDTVTGDDAVLTETVDALGTFADEDVAQAADDQDYTLEGGSGNDVLMGAGGNDILSGGEGDDILFGAGGDDTSTGGEGSDTFLYTDASEGSADETIIDFDVDDADGDVDTLDLAEVLSGDASEDDISITDAVVGETEVSVDPDGTGTETAAPLVTIESEITLDNLLANTDTGSDV